jgi:hypothetical protein
MMTPPPPEQVILNKWAAECKKIGCNEKDIPKVNDPELLESTRKLIRDKLNIYEMDEFAAAIEKKGRERFIAASTNESEGEGLFVKFTWMHLRDALTMTIREVRKPHGGPRLMSPDKERERKENYEKKWAGGSAEVWKRMVPELIDLAEMLGFAMRLDQHEPEKAHWEWLLTKVDAKNIGPDSTYPSWKEAIKFAIEDAKTAAREVRRSPDSNGRVFMPTEQIAARFTYMDDAGCEQKRHPAKVESEIKRMYELHGVGNLMIPSYANMFTLDCLKAYRDEYLTADK